jgi:hypothetical protein
MTFSFYVISDFACYSSKYFLFGVPFPVINREPTQIQKVRCAARTLVVLWVHSYLFLDLDEPSPTSQRSLSSSSFSIRKDPATINIVSRIMARHETATLLLSKVRSESPFTITVTKSHPSYIRPVRRFLWKLIAREEIRDRH